MEICTIKYIEIYFTSCRHNFDGPIYIEMTIFRSSIKTLADVMNQYSMRKVDGCLFKSVPLNSRPIV